MSRTGSKKKFGIAFCGGRQDGKRHLPQLQKAFGEILQANVALDISGKMCCGSADLKSATDDENNAI